MKSLGEFEGSFFRVLCIIVLYTYIVIIVIGNNTYMKLKGIVYKSL